MIKLMIEKELKEIIGSTKFVATFTVCSVLILLTFYVGAHNYHLSAAHYQAAKAENLRKMQGLTDWLQVNNHRIFLPPQPLEALVTGVSNDIGRTIEVAGRGELLANSSRFGDDPIFAIFRFLDLDFIFQIVLSLFAVLFAYNAVNGEKERGTLKLSFANAIPKDKYILGKLAGAFLALAVPLLIPILLGCLLLPVLNVHLNSQEWGKLLLVVFSGFLYLGVFLTLSVFVSGLTNKSANSFLILLVVWIFSVLIIPRTSVLLAGRAVEVPTVDEIFAQKSRLRAQLWSEDRKRIESFQPTATGDLQKMSQEFQAFMNDLSSNRDNQMQKLAKQLKEDRENRQRLQESLAFGLARISPTAALSLATTKLAGTSLRQQENYLLQANNYQKVFAAFMKEKTGMTLDGRHMFMRIDDSEAQQKPIDPRELPDFQYRQPPLAEAVDDALPEMATLAAFNIVFFAGAFVRFLKYDVR